MAPLLFKQLNEEPKPMQERGAVLSVRTTQLVNKMMARDMNDRFANMGEVKRAIQEALDSLDK